MPKYIEFLCAEHIERYIQTVKGINATRNKHLAIIRSFCRYLADFYDLPNPTLKMKDLPEDPPRQKIINDAQYERILAACENQEQRDIVQFLGNTGLRESEFRSLTWQNVSSEQQCLILTGKGKKRRIVPLNDVCRAVLARKANSHIYLFKSTKNKLYRLLKTLSCRAGLSFVASAHTYRHFYTTRLIRAGAKIAIVSKSLGHSEISTTLRIYEHLLPSDVLGLTDILDK